jgi:ABC-type transporter lipoprotein component MlaA/pimeloyl-ACP methyl ester carboxylesterase
LALAVLVCGLSTFARGQTPAAVPTPTAVLDSVVLPKSVPDPLEPLNRAIWVFNKGVMTGVIKPTARVYRLIFFKQLRLGIGNIGKNLVYPGRLINNLLQGKWDGARDESYRFIYNSSVGIAGFFDRASEQNIPKSDADFGQTFGQWGWKPVCYLMLPFLGPSNERDLLGFAADTAANPLIYIAPYKLDVNDPLTYMGPYTYFNYAVTYNELSDTVDEYVRFGRAEADPYSEIQYAWTFARENRVADFQVRGKRDEASLETTESVFFTYKDPEFPGRGKTRSVLIPATGRELRFTFWMRPGKAPVVYIIPGLGGHRLAQTSLALAELVYKNGYSAVCLSSPFHPEFMESASTAAMPAYLPVDGCDLRVALAEIDRRLNKMYPDRLAGRALMGYSMGALESLYIASAEPTNRAPLVKFDRYVALNTPVRMLHGVAKLDEFYRAPLDWPAGERASDLENTFLKVAALSKSTLTPQTSLPFNAIESKFLIGLSFRLVLRDVIYSSQRRDNQGVLRHPVAHMRRDPVYQEILGYSYQDYFDKFAIPYYQARGLAAPAGTLTAAGDLRTYEAGLRANPGIRVIVNENDFLLAPEDLAWLHAAFGPDRLTTFGEGGHLGNLGNPAVQKSILDALGGLKPSATKSR